ncbi:MAG: hypothetical protein HYX43_04675 [Burkholderiales bacterium]|nr:hypothetical protein [Burkholderiales bacterium]
MHEAVGRAVLSAQIFESFFVICVKLHGMVASGVSSLIEPEHFKVATRTLVKNLSSANEIAPEFEERINELIEKRHLLIHRWFIEHGLPGDQDTAYLAQLTQLARDVEQGSNGITTLLVGYLLRWGKANPEQNVLADPERSRLLALFQRAHLGDTGD